MIKNHDNIMIEMIFDYLCKSNYLKTFYYD